MSESSVFTCDGCGATTSDIGNWFQLAIAQNIRLFYPIAHFCSPACLKKAPDIATRKLASK